MSAPSQERFRLPTAQICHKTPFNLSYRIRHVLNAGVPWLYHDVNKLGTYRELQCREQILCRICLTCVLDPKTPRQKLQVKLLSRRTLISSRAVRAVIKSYNRKVVSCQLRDATQNIWIHQEASISVEHDDFAFVIKGNTKPDRRS